MNQIDDILLTSFFEHHNKIETLMKAESFNIVKIGQLKDQNKDIKNKLHDTRLSLKALTDELINRGYERIENGWRKGMKTHIGSLNEQ